MSSLTQVQPAATVPRWRRITFYVIAALVLLMILGLLWPLLMFIVFTWMPIDTVRDILAVVFPAEDLGAVAEAHRIHLLSLALASGSNCGSRRGDKRRCCKRWRWSRPSW